MAPLSRRRKRALAAAHPAIHPADRLSKLPDDVLAHILSFLPAQEAVRTCVLARTWRHLWKLTRRLLITADRDRRMSVLEAREFVDRLLRLRLDGLERASLDECDIMFHICHEDHEPSHSAVSRWIRHALRCQVQVLRVLNEDEGHEFEDYFVMSCRPLVSRRLTRLELCGIRFDCIELNLDGCPALELLEIRACNLLDVRKIMSPSLKRLVITDCDSDGDSRRIKIGVPRLVSLWLEVWAHRAPLLESMPELVDAYVKIDSFSRGDDCFVMIPCVAITLPEQATFQIVTLIATMYKIQKIILEQIQRAVRFLKV